VGVEASAFEEVEEEHRRGVLLVQGIDSTIKGLAANPMKQEFAVASAAGTLQLWSMEHRSLKMVASFKEEKVEPSCLAFDSQGRYLAQAFANGLLMFLELEQLRILRRYRNTTKNITHVKVSPDGVFVAIADVDFCVSIYRHKEKDAINGTEADWVYLGKNKAHSAAITGLEFGMSTDDQLLLVSVAEDQHVAEFDLALSSVSKGVVFKHKRIRVADTETPTCCLWNPLDVRMSDSIVVIANTGFKFEMWSTIRAECISTALAPAYAGPVTRMLLLSQAESTYMAYATFDKVVGLVKFPLDGNPTKSMGIIAHPGEICEIAASCGGKFLITAGRQDMTVSIWDIDTSVVDHEAAKLPGIEPYLKLLGEGEAGGETYEELRDYFCYSQLRAKGEASTDKRKVTGRVSLTELPNLMRALGFYPSQKQIKRITEEARIRKTGRASNDGGEAAKDIGLHDFVRLYINHRPVFGVSNSDIEAAFKTLGADPNANSSLSWNELKYRLQHQGEAISDTELKTILAALRGGDEVPVQMDANEFASEVLGFD
jgi:WD40 repeat protein/Ca2+-binding EF-hand superfamily protein